MKKTVSYSKSQLLDDLGRLALMVLASVIMAVNLKSFVQAGDLVPGGFNGLTLLIQRVALRFWGLSVPFSAINFLLNAVPAVISFKLIGKRFTLFSCVVILCTSLLTDLIPPMPITDDVLLICIFGGLINGFAISLCLRGRATSGGTDFISIALSQQYDVDAWNYIFMGNVVMLAVSGALFGWDKALYSILFQFASTQVIKLLDPSGRRATLFIVTRRETAQAVWQQIRDTHHSATLFQGTGLYDGEERVMLYSVVGGNQVRALIHRVLLDKEQEEAVEERRRDYKTELQELVQRRSNQTLHYEMIGATGPDHARQFTCAVLLNGETAGTGTGRSKKEAEQSAARAALQALA